MKALVDMDIIVYTVGSICDNRFWEYKGERYNNKTELNIILKEDGVDPSTVEVQTEPDTELECKKKLVDYVEGLLGDYMDYQGFISGKGNFRYQRATILPYKGHRASLEKPFHYDNVRKFLVDIYEAKVSEGKEADDDIGLAQIPGETVIVTLDKDLDCVPGHHYNWKSTKQYELSEVEANRCFFSQVLTGDKATDNILGLFGVGKESALVKKINKMEDVDSMFKLVQEEYEKRFGSYWKLFLKENSDLLWILQRRQNPMENYLNDNALCKTWDILQSRDLRWLNNFRRALSEK